MGAYGGMQTGLQIGMMPTMYGMMSKAGTAAKTATVANRSSGILSLSQSPQSIIGQQVYRNSLSLTGVPDFAISDAFMNAQYGYGFTP